MVCARTFTIKGATDFKSFDDWVIFLKENEEHLKSKSFVTDYVGKIDPYLLPSLHPYWSDQVYKEDCKQMKILLKKYKECYLNNEIIKFYFGYRSIEEVKKDIKAKLKRIKKLKENIRY